MPSIASVPPCPVCSGARATELLRIRRVPIFCNVLYDSPDQARRAPRADIAPAYCPDCSHLYNSEFDPELVRYSPGYENSLHFSPLFRQYARDLATRLVDRYDLHGKTIVEIGSGDGDFLRRICEQGGNRGLGFDPSGKEGREGPVTFIRDYFTDKYAGCRPDFVCCRHVLEHVDTPVAFVGMIRDALVATPGAVVYFEVPNVEYTLRDRGIWDLIYEHCGYYSTDSLRHLFEKSGFDVLRVDAAYGGQFLGIEAAAAGRKQSKRSDLKPSASLPDHALDFAQEYRRKTAFWKNRLVRLRKTERDVVLWGAGSKGATFLNIMEDPGIRCAVDVNPRKRGRFVAGTGHPIMSPDELKGLAAPAVIVMNPRYRGEIGTILSELGVTAVVMTA